MLSQINLTWDVFWMTVAGLQTFSSICLPLPLFCSQTQLLWQASLRRLWPSSPSRKILAEKETAHLHALNEFTNLQETYTVITVKKLIRKGSFSYNIFLNGITSLVMPRENVNNVLQLHNLFALYTCMHSLLLFTVLFDANP